LDFVAGGRDPNSVVIADVNGDGKPDLVTANSDTNSVSVLIGNGNGTFQPKVDYATVHPEVVAVADLNADGKADLVTVSPTSSTGTVSVLINVNGTFPSRTDYAVGSCAYAVAVGDVNGDGKPDIVADVSCGNTVSALLGIGDGTFPNRMTFGASTFSYSVAIGDLNGDGKPDLVTTSNDSNTVSVLLSVSGVTLDVPGTDRPVVRSQLDPARPSPFQSSTSISFNLPAVSRVKLEILDIEGRRVATLVDASLPAGRHVAEWTGCDDHGRIAGAGVYFARLMVPNGALERTIIHLR
jgi:hypothetical protein